MSVSASARQARILGDLDGEEGVLESLLDRRAFCRLPAKKTFEECEEALRGDGVARNHVLRRKKGGQSSSAGAQGEETGLTRSERIWLTNFLLCFVVEAMGKSRTRDAGDLTMNHSG